MNAVNKIIGWKKTQNVNKVCRYDESDTEQERRSYSEFGSHKELLQAKYGSDLVHLRDLQSAQVESLKCIGFGKFSIVKKGYSNKYQDDVAVKIIMRRDKSNKLYLNKYLPQEIRIWRELSLNKPENILLLKEHIKTNKYIYVLTDVLEYGNLHDFVLKVAINERRGRSIFNGIVNAVCYCHQRRIAHRDVKPGNILMGKGDTVKLSDFSFVTKANPVSSEHCGTRTMLSPEQRSGRSYNPLISDLWQLGLTLYMMLFRRLPYKNHKKKDLLVEIEGFTNHHKGVPYPRYNVTHECKELISGMLTIDPCSRLTIDDVKLSPWLLNETVES